MPGREYVAHWEHWNACTWNQHGCLAEQTAVKCSPCCPYMCICLSHDHPSCQMHICHCQPVQRILINHSTSHICLLITKTWIQAGIVFHIWAPAYDFYLSHFLCCMMLSIRNEFSFRPCYMSLTFLGKSECLSLITACSWPANVVLWGKSFYVYLQLKLCGRICVGGTFPLHMIENCNTLILKCPILVWNGNEFKNFLLLEDIWTNFQHDIKQNNIIIISCGPFVAQ